MTFYVPKDSETVCPRQFLFDPRNYSVPGKIENESGLSSEGNELFSYITHPDKECELQDITTFKIKTLPENLILAKEESAKSAFFKEMNEIFRSERPVGKYFIDNVKIGYLERYGSEQIIVLKDSLKGKCVDEILSRLVTNKYKKELPEEDIISTFRSPEDGFLRMNSIVVEKIEKDYTKTENKLHMGMSVEEFRELEPDRSMRVVLGKADCEED